MCLKSVLEGVFEKFWIVFCFVSAWKMFNVFEKCVGRCFEKFWIVFCFVSAWKVFHVFEKWFGRCLGKVLDRVLLRICLESV